MSKPSQSWRIPYLLKIFQQLKPPKHSSEYLIWRNQFMWRRIGLLLWVSLAVHFSAILLDIYRVFYLRTGGDYPYESRYFLLLENIIFTLLLVTCFIVHKIKFGHRYPSIIFLAFSWTCTLVLQIFRTFNLPGSVILNVAVWGLLFSGQATLIPVCWRLHLISQIVPFSYFLVNTLVRGYTKYNSHPILPPELIIALVWFFIICNLGVYLYEKLQLTEFESRRELKVFLHAITHDLRTPLMGNSIVLQRLLKKTDKQITINRSLLERMFEGNSRQIDLINTLQKAYSYETYGIELHKQPLQISNLIALVLEDLKPLITQNRVKITNLIDADLPLVYADAVQLRRVLTNLISNALKHNPYDITLTLDARVKVKKIICYVEDDGVGMSKDECMRIFELYSRGENARLMPGLGLGLYVCQQIIVAHGGKIGVRSKPGNGSTFWFTLPVIH